MKSIPYLQKAKSGTFLMVDDQPFLPVGGELHNSSGSDLYYMDEVVWPKLRQVGGNCYLVPAYWECVEPEPGVYDFTLVDGLIQQAKREDVRLMLLWFGTWKNGKSDYVPQWLKENRDSYFLARDEQGVPLNVISPFCNAVLDKDAKAFAQLMKHLAEYDEERTVIMVQVENEVGIWFHDRDFCPEANALFGAQVPDEVAEAFQVEGNWQQAFGERACDVFMSWAYSKAIEKVASAGRKEYALPLFVNCVPMGMGFCPTGGPDASVHDVWMKFAPSIDIYSPDIYAPDYKTISGRFRHDNNPLFIPETNCDNNAASKFIYSMGQHNCMGFHPFGIEEAGGKVLDIDYASNGFEVLGLANTGKNLNKAYNLIWTIWPQIRDAHANGKIYAFLAQPGERGYEIETQGYKIKIRYGINRPQENAPLSAGLIIETAPDSFLLCGVNCTLSFMPANGEMGTVFVQDKREMRVVDGKLVQGRYLNGDERNQTAIGATPEIITFKLDRFL